MQSPELIESVRKFEKDALKTVFQAMYSRLAAVAERYSKNASQAQELILSGFTAAFKKLAILKEVDDIDLSAFVEREFILECVRYIKSFRSEYYVSSTVYATQPTLQTHDLFDEITPPDYNQVSDELYVKSIQQLVPAQRLAFNMCVIDNFTVEETAALLETSEPTVKSNLEKARYHLQKHIDKLHKTQKS